MSKLAKLQGDTIVLSFSYHLDIVKAIKDILGRKYLPKEKQWTIPFTLENCYFIKRLGFSFSTELKDAANAEYSRLDCPLDLTGLKATLFPYQVEGVKFLKKKAGRAIIADEMGLGKTLQGLAWLQMSKKHLPAVVVCPASLKYNWAAEIGKWMTGVSYSILSGTSPTVLPFVDIYIINYDILIEDYTRGESGRLNIHSGWCKVLRQLEIRTVILDEAHYIKSNSALRTKATQYLCKGVSHIIPLTGTPIENKTSEIFNLLELVVPGQFGNRWGFMMNYCRPINNGFGWSYDNEPRNEKEKEKWDAKRVELYQKLQKCLIRRKKKDVLPELPDKIYSFIPLPLTNEKEYDAAEADFISFLSTKIRREILEKLETIEKTLGVANTTEVDALSIITQVAEEKDNPLVRLEVLKQLAVQGILDGAISWIEDFLDSGEKIVVFATHKFVVDALMNKFHKHAVKVDGSVSAKDRQKAVELFQNNKKVKIFVGNIQAAGVGLTLTASSNVCFLEYPMVPGQFSQAVDRCHRIGQKNTVNVWMLGAQKPIIETIIHTLERKQKVIETTLEGRLGENTNILGSILGEITKQYTDDKEIRN